jgi:putative ABC transport system permease protein
VVVVSQAFRRMHFPDEDDPAVLGRRLSINGPRGPWRRIVGVVRDSKYRAVVEGPTPVVYRPLAQNHETGVALFARTTLDPESLVAAVRREIQGIEPNLPVPGIQPATRMIAGSLYAPRMAALLLTAFAGLALALAAVGVYGVMAFSVSRRTRELGIRLALGADRGSIFTLVLRDGLRLVALGVALGLAGAALGARPLARFLYGVGPADGVTFVSVSVILVVVAVLACLGPARGATRVDPMAALRYE